MRGDNDGNDAVMCCECVKSAGIDQKALQDADKTGGLLLKGYKNALLLFKEPRCNEGSLMGMIPVHKNRKKPIRGFSIDQ